MNNNIKKLADLIATLKNDTDFGNISEDGYRYAKITDTTNEISYLACETLIDRGYPVYENIWELQDLNVIKGVKCGERDSYGWLTGLILLEDNRVIVFG